MKGVASLCQMAACQEANVRAAVDQKPDAQEQTRGGRSTAGWLWAWACTGPARGPGPPPVAGSLSHRQGLLRIT